jgi:hypothetical protein
MVEDLMAAPLNSPLHSPLRSPLRSPFASKWGADPQVVLTAYTVNETALVGDLVATISVANLPTGITADSYAITADPDTKFVLDGVDDTRLELEATVDYSTDASTVSRTIAIGVLDTAAPTLSSSTPADNATGVAVNASPALVFSENVFFNYPGGGTFSLKLVGGATVETFTPTSTTAATGSAGGTASITTTTLTINPFADLAESTAHCIRIAADCLEDDAGNAYAGIANDTALSFTSGTDGWAGIDFTAGSVPVTVTATGGTNGTRINSSGVVVAGSTGRLTYNPVSPFASYGIENEPARTNTCTYSEDLTNAAWVLGASTSVSLSSEVAPDGGTNYPLITFSATNFDAAIYFLDTTNVTAGQKVQISFWAKAGSAASLNVWVNGEGNGGNNINLVTFTPAATSTRYTYEYTVVNNDTGLYVGFGGFVTTQAAGTVYIWGVQIEIDAAYATSDILTAGATVTRTADVLKYTPPAGVTDVRYTYQDNTTADASVTPEVEVTITNGALAIKTITDVTP